jgi:hypothetical protein
MDSCDYEDIIYISSHHSNQTLRPSNEYTEASAIGMHQMLSDKTKKNKCIKLGI